MDLSSTPPQPQPMQQTIFIHGFKLMAAGIDWAFWLPKVVITVTVQTQAAHTVMTDSISGDWIQALRWLMGWGAWPQLSSTAERVSLVTRTGRSILPHRHEALQAQVDNPMPTENHALPVTACPFSFQEVTVAVSQYGLAEDFSYTCRA